jgi:hypothetical protein
MRRFGLLRPTRRATPSRGASPLSGQHSGRIRRATPLTQDQDGTMFAWEGARQLPFPAGQRKAGGQVERFREEIMLWHQYDRGCQGCSNSARILAPRNKQLSEKDRDYSLSCAKIGARLRSFPAPRKRRIILPTEPDVRSTRPRSRWQEVDRLSPPSFTRKLSFGPAHPMGESTLFGLVDRAPSISVNRNFTAWRRSRDLRYPPTGTLAGRSSRS